MIWAYHNYLLALQNLGEKEKSKPGVSTGEYKRHVCGENSHVFVRLQYSEKALCAPCKLANTQLPYSHTCSRVILNSGIYTYIYICTLPQYNTNCWEIEPCSVSILLTVWLKSFSCFSVESIYEKGEGQQGSCFLPQQSEDLWPEIQRGATPVLLLSEIWALFFSWISSIALKTQRSANPITSHPEAGLHVTDVTCSSACSEKLENGWGRKGSVSIVKEPLWRWKSQQSFPSGRERWNIL